MISEKDAMWRVQTRRIAVTDANLFLDTHPTNKLALEYYNSALEDFKEALFDYQDQFGPINVYHGTFDSPFSWVETPWPWEREVK